jgi:hypothetical protein
MFGDYINKNIQRTLFNRIDVLNRVNQYNSKDPLEPTNLNLNQDSFLVGTTWARATSAVPDVTRNEYGEITDVSTDKLFRLSSALNDDGNPKNEPLQNVSGRARGHNGITGISVEFMNQQTLMTTISWVLNDPMKDFEIYQNAFLKLNRMVSVEFGWSREKPQEIPNIETSQEQLRLFKANQQKMEEYGGDYFTTTGTIKNFNYTLGDGGRYICTTELVSMGQQLFKSPVGKTEESETPGLVTEFGIREARKREKVNQKIRKAGEEGLKTAQTKEQKEELKKRILTATKSSFERTMSNLNGHIQSLKGPFAGLESLKDLVITGWMGMIDKLKEGEFDDSNIETKGFDDPDRKVGKAAADLKKLYDTDNQIYVNGGKAWCTWGWFEDNILNTYFGLYKPVPTNNDWEADWVARFNSSEKINGVYVPNLCKTNENLFTKSFDIVFPGRTVEISGTIIDGMTKKSTKAVAAAKKIEDWTGDVYRLDTTRRGGGTLRYRWFVKSKTRAKWQWSKDKNVKKWNDVSSDVKIEDLIGGTMRNVGKGATQPHVEIIKKLNQGGPRIGKKVLTDEDFSFEYKKGNKTKTMSPGDKYYEKTEKIFPSVVDTLELPDPTDPKNEQPKLKQEKDLSDYETVQKVYSDINRNFLPFEPDKASTGGIIRNIVFSADILTKYFSSTTDIGSSINAFWAYVNSQYGGFWDFQMLSAQGDPTMVGVFDRSITRKRVSECINFPDSTNKSTRETPKKSFEFKAYSKDSLLRDLSFTTNISSEMMTQAALSGQSSVEVKGGAFGESTNDYQEQAIQAFAALQGMKYLDEKLMNADIEVKKLQKDKILSEVTTPNMSGQSSFRNKGKLTVKKQTTTLQAEEKQVKEIQKSLITDDDIPEYDGYTWFDVAEDLDNRGLVYLPNGEMHNSYAKTMDYFLNKTEKARRSVDVPIPFNCNFSIAGISGIKLYDYFTIDYLPPLYRTFAVFQVTSIGHQLDSSGWVTSISGMMRVDMDTLAKEVGYEVEDKVRDEIKYIDETKWIEVLNETLRNTITENKEKEKGDSDVEDPTGKYKTKSEPIARVMRINGTGKAYINGNITKPGSPVYEADEVATTEDAMLIIIFLDDKTILKIRPLYSAIVTKGSNFKQNLRDAKGLVKTNSNQRGYRVVTSVSVASIKG